MSKFTATRWVAVISAAVALPLALTACSGTGKVTTTTGATKSDHTYSVITHGAPGDAFWDVVKSGSEAAAKAYGVKVTYQGDSDPVKQSQLIKSAIAQKVDGLIVSMANVDGVRAALKDAAAAHIPVITINSGAESFTAVGALTHVGQSEFPAGQGAGEKFTAASAKHVICVVHEAGNVGLEQRCAGAGDKLKGKVENVQVDVSNLADAGNTIKSKLLADPTIDGILTLNPAIAVVASTAVADAKSSATIGTFDVSSDVTKLIISGKISFAIDQQPYLQGYLPVSFLELYLLNGDVVGGGQVVNSGPGFITKDNAAKVAKFAANGTR